MKSAVLKAGYGYWDVTYYPYGGCFARSKFPLVVELTGETHSKCGVQFKFDAGNRIGWTSADGMEIAA